MQQQKKGKIQFGKYVPMQIKKRKLSKKMKIEIFDYSKHRVL